jgi:hypothetical protein
MSMISCEDARTSPSPRSSGSWPGPQPDSSTDPDAWVSRFLLVLLPLVKLAIHLAAIRGYGYFRDELYYIVCSERLAAGYVDHPPLSIAVLAFTRAVLGESLPAIRLPAALAGALTVLVTGLTARRAGGGAWAQATAMIAVIAAPAYLGMNSYFSMNSFDLLFWALASWLLVRLLETGDLRLWLWIGVVAGLGLLNKISMLWFIGALAFALLLTPERRQLRTPWPWLGGAVAASLFLPNLVWQAQNGWPTLEFMAGATAEKMRIISPAEFLGGQILFLNPVSLPVWLAGLGFCLFSREGRRLRVLGLIWVLVFLLLIWSQKSRTSYLMPAYVPLLAVGAAALERVSARRRARPVALLLPVLPLALLVSGAVLAPLRLPILDVTTYIRYTDFLGVAPTTDEKKRLGDLPQRFADMHGWPELVETVAVSVARLSPAERRRAVILTSNYGEAAALHVLGRDRSLPPVISGHNTFWLWGPGGFTGQVMIAVGEDREMLEPLFASVEPLAVTACEHCMPYENGLPVHVCRRSRRPVSEVWLELKHYD